MEWIREIKDYYSEKKTAVTIGKFNGLHKGHALLLSKIAKYSSEDISSVLFAFDVRGKFLLTEDEMMDRLDGSINTLFMCPLDNNIKKMSAEAFIEEILVKKLNARYIVVGEDFRFGHNRLGDASLLKKYARQYGYYVDVVPEVMYGDKVISSSYIKQVLGSGDIKLANALLGHEYEISGVVGEGRKLGRTIGFPTVNLTPPPTKMLPLYGVYGCAVSVDNKEYEGICNIGEKPTVINETKPMVETYIFDYNEDAYGKRAVVKPLLFVRNEKKFSSIEELKLQIKRDIEAVKLFHLNQE